MDVPRQVSLIKVSASTMQGLWCAFNNVVNNAAQAASDAPVVLQAANANAAKATEMAIEVLCIAGNLLVASAWPWLWRTYQPIILEPLLWWCSPLLRLLEIVMAVVVLRCVFTNIWRSPLLSMEGLARMRQQPAPAQAPLQAPRQPRADPGTPNGRAPEGDDAQDAPAPQQPQPQSPTYTVRVGYGSELYLGHNNELRMGSGHWDTHAWRIVSRDGHFPLKSDEEATVSLINNARPSVCLKVGGRHRNELVAGHYHEHELGCQFILKAKLVLGQMRYLMRSADTQRYACYGGPAFFFWIGSAHTIRVDRTPDNIHELNPLSWEHIFITQMG